MAVNELEISKQVKRLAAVFNTQKPIEEIVEAWKWVLGEDLEYFELMGAVSDYAKSGARYFPNPGQIREAALSRRGPGSYEAEEHKRQNDDQFLRCPTCDAVLRELTPAEQVWTVWDEDRQAYVNILPEARGARMGILHDYKRHREARADIIGSYRR